MRQGKAFTLIELLVVVAIIALLVSILVPSLGTARQAAQRVVCMSNLKQFTYAFQYYCGDNNGQMPEFSHVFGGAPGDWYYEFTRYLGESSAAQDVWDCPADEHKDTNNHGYGPAFANLLSYRLGLGYPWPVERPPHNVYHIANTSEIMGLTEMWAPQEAVLTPYGPTAYSTFPLDYDFDGDGVNDSNSYELMLGKTIYGYYTPYNRVAARHRGRVCNIGFLDGHVESQFINDMLYNRVLWGVELVGMPAVLE